MKEYDYIKLIKGIVDTDLNIIGDDTAIIKDSGLVLTCDTLVENTHFNLSTTSAYDLGFKAGAVNLSDIATTGGQCDYILVSLAFSNDIDEYFLKDFYSGLKSICDEFNTSIVGGDLTYNDKLIITITAIGKTNKVTGRNFAKQGQKILTTGDYGASYTGLKLLNSLNNENYSKVFTPKLKPSIDYIISRHRKPQPRIKEAQFITEILGYKEYCMMDTSDGLADALYQISQKSKKRLDIYIDSIPIHQSLFEINLLLSINSFQAALYGGEDFELIFTCDETDLDKLLNNDHYSFKVIGEVLDDEPGVSLITENTSLELDEYLLEEEISFKHFR